MVSILFLNLFCPPTSQQVARVRAPPTSQTYPTAQLVQSLPRLSQTPKTPADSHRLLRLLRSYGFLTPVSPALGRQYSPPPGRSPKPSMLMPGLPCAPLGLQKRFLKLSRATEGALGHHSLRDNGSRHTTLKNIKKQCTKPLNHILQHQQTLKTIYEHETH